MIQYICAEKTGQLVCEGVETGVEVVDFDSGTQIQKNCTLMVIIFRQTRLIFKRKELKYQLFLLLLCKDKNGIKCIGHQLCQMSNFDTPNTKIIAPCGVLNLKIFSNMLLLSINKNRTVACWKTFYYCIFLFTSVGRLFFY